MSGEAASALPLVSSDRETENEETRDALEKAKKALGEVDAIVKATALHSLDKKAALEAIDYGVRAKLSGARELLRTS